MQQKEIKLDNGKRVIINKWGTLKQISKLPLVTKTLGVPFFMVATNAQNEEALLESLPSALFLLCEQLEENGVEAFFNSLLEGTWINGSEQATCESFEDIDDLLFVLADILKMNYSKLLEGKGFTAFRTVAVPLAATNQE